MKVTVPVGVLNGFVVSVTVAVQVDAPLIKMLLGVQATAVTGGRPATTMIVFDIPVLPL